MATSSAEIFARIRGGYGIKLVVIGIVLICFIPPLAMVGRIIRERATRSEQAQAEVIDSWGGPTTITGPYLAIPAHRFEPLVGTAGGPSVRRVTATIVLFPEALDAVFDLESDIRSRGIYSAAVYTTDVSLTGRFDLARVSDEYGEWELAWDEATLTLHTGSLSGLAGLEEVVLAGSPLEFDPADTQRLAWGEAISAPFDLDPRVRRELAFSLELVVNGGGSLAIVPVGRQTNVRIDSDWPAPSFFGSLLPATRDLRDDGFSAHWSVSHLSRSLPMHFAMSDVVPALTAPFGFALIRPDDPYSRNERSFKYAWLFLIVPFLTFFVFEVVRKVRIHAVQYLLAGSADVVFYLLLLSVSEHLTFTIAYLVSAVAITALLGAYGSTVMRGGRQGLLLGGMIGLGYGYLAVVLHSEDYALLLGSLGLFVVLALVMFLTRNIAWFNDDREYRPEIEPDA